MTRALPPLFILSVMVFVAVLILCINLELDFQEDALSSFLYLSILAPLPVIIYRIGMAKLDSRLPLLLIVLGFVCKLIASGFRYWTLFEVYGGGGDAVSYHQLGREFSEMSPVPDFSYVRGEVAGSEGTAWVTYLTSLLYTVFPPSLLGSFFFFASLAFVGSFLFYRTYCIAFPEAPRKLFAILIFFMPSILYWPSSLGKDAWIFFSSGVVAYGAVRFIRSNDIRGIVIAIAGLGLAILIRPHVATVMAMALLGGYLCSIKMIAKGNLVKWLVFGCVVVGLAVFTLQFSSQYFLGLELREVSWEEAESFYEFRQTVSAKGGSAFAAPSILNPVGPLYAVATVMLRPFPWEVHNAQALLTSAESLFWIALIWRRRRVFWERIRSIVNDPFTGFVLIYTVLMILALTTAGNLGIVARQRVMFIPFLLMLFA